MAYREKIAWLSLFAMTVGFGPYFVAAAVASSGGSPSTARSLAWLGMAATVHVLVLGAGHLYLRSTAPADARTPADERDRAIERRSVAAAYYVLIAGTVLVGVVMPFNAGGWEITNAALFAVVTAEVVQYVGAVTGYRLQS